MSDDLGAHNRSDPATSPGEKRRYRAMTILNGFTLPGASNLLTMGVAPYPPIPSYADCPRQRTFSPTWPS